MGDPLDRDYRIVTRLPPWYEVLVKELDGRECPALLFHMVIDQWLVSFTAERDTAWLCDLWALFSDYASCYSTSQEEDLIEVEMRQWDDIAMRTGHFVEEHIMEINQWLWAVCRGRPDEWQDPIINHLNRTLILHRFVTTQ